MPRSGELISPKKENLNKFAASPESTIVILLIEMMRKLKKIGPDILFGTFLVLIGLYLALQNYNPGTFLTGWDSLHPEFNFPLALSRILSGVWREEQGVGAIAAHSHMTELPRLLFLWLSSFVLPMSFLRYFYVFVCLILGPLGVYFFLKYVLKKEENNPSVYIPSFLGGLYYLLNLGTLQHFTVPFEMFQTAYAFLPWIFYLGLKFIREGGKRNLVFLSLVLILGAPMAYAATLFYASFLGLFLFLLFYWLISANRITILKRLLALLLLTIGLNSYWILPNLYSILNQSRVVEISKINTLFSPEAFLRNEDYGTLPDILLHKNFLFSWRAYDFNEGTYNDLLGVWNNYFSRPEIANLGYLIVAVCILGFVLSLIKREKIGFALLPTLAFVLFFLFNANPPTGVLYSFLHERIGLFREALRMPFTKVSFLFMFAMAFYFAYMTNFMLESVKKFRFLKIIVSILLVGSLSFILLSFMLPAFEGNLINPIVRRSLPNEYFQAFNWFKGKEGRIAELPMHTLWGWEYHDWRYEGSGFIQYGIENPILQRDYDRWGPYNEGFYNEASFALYSNDNEAFLRTLKKYQVKYVLLDESVINAGGDDKLLFIPQIKSALSDFKEAAKFGFITIYQTDFSQGDKFISVPSSYTRVNVNLTYSQLDPIYAKYGDYIEDEKGMGYPFVNFDRRGDVKVSISNDLITLENRQANVKVVLPAQNVINETFSQNRGFPEGYNCDLKKKGEIVKKRLGFGNYYAAYESGVSCDYFYYPDIKYNQGYILRVKGVNLKGRGLKIYLQNISTEKMDLEELLPTGAFDETFAILPKPNLTGNEGYTLNIETRSFGRVSSENIIEKIEFYPVDFNSLNTFKGATLQDVYSIQNNLKILNVQKLGNWMYIIDAQGDGLLELGQGFESGWTALSTANGQWQIVNKLQHIKANSWANGWMVPQSSTIYIVFWPQLLEYLGFIILAGTLALVLTKR